MTLVALGVGAQRSPRYAPAGLLVLHRGRRVMIDGGGGAVPRGRLDAWLVTDDRAELIADIRRLAGRWHLIPRAASFRGDGLAIERKAVTHTSHPTYGYRIEAQGRVIVWAPEFMRFPRWARGADLMFAEAAGWDRPIRFAGRVGGHLDVVSVARAARDHGVKRLVFAHIGRPTLRALERHARPSFGEFAVDGQRFAVPRACASAAADGSGRRRAASARERRRPDRHASHRTGLWRPAAGS
jgi:Beta-lactamase superfamily domain